MSNQSPSTEYTIYHHHNVSSHVNPFHAKHIHLISLQGNALPWLCYAATAYLYVYALRCAVNLLLDVLSWCGIFATL